ncbi:MAG: phenylalanine--tRNA ligase subunit alpha [Patescibacteria group bacterium]|jgi:phenylalanyl-tRNA synthetase alpha chain
MKDKILQIKQEIQQALAQVNDAKSLEELKIKYVGRKDGKLTNLLKKIKDLPVEQKKEVGSVANQTRAEIFSMLEIAQKKLGAKKEENTFFDVTLPGQGDPSGHVHPITQVRLQAEEIFKTMGFAIHEGNELVSDFYNFESLNIPKDHPARDTQDTFFIKNQPNMAMRTHTSTMQVKIMENHTPPLKIIVPGRVFRNEATDASHEFTFHQLEGFVVDENISIAHLIWTLKKLLSAILNRDLEVRLRPGYFPFVEPGFEMDCSCLNCGGKGCGACKQSGWVEMIGCGMIHPKVFEHAGYPKGKYTGFAFGIGLSRLAMMKYKITDIRSFMSGDLRFLKQF